MATPVNTSVQANFWETKGYHIGTFECFKDIPTTVAVCCCPCLVLGHVVGQMDKQGFNLVACLCSGISLYRLRRNVQAKFGISESEDASTCGVSLCGMCTAVQDIHELEKRGEIKLFGGAGGGASPAMTAQPAGDTMAQ